MGFRDRRVLAGAAVVLAVVAVAALVLVLVRAGTSERTDPDRLPTSQAPAAVAGASDVPYGNQPLQKLDVWFPKTTAAGETLPTIVWVHGGGWSAGDKGAIAPYLQVLAERGFTVVGVNYSLSPAAKYPTQVQEVNVALGYLTAHATDLHIDPDRLVLAGDSGGAQIAGQVAALTTNPTFSAEVGIDPVLEPTQISGLLLASGAFDLEHSAKRINAAARRYVDDYLGTTSDDELLERASVAPHVTSSFPPTWMTSGNADPLAPQAKDLADDLSGAGVEVDTVFYAKSHQPQLIHEYQFDLNLGESQNALESAVRFVKKQTS